MFCLVAILFTAVELRTLLKCFCPTKAWCIPVIELSDGDFTMAADTYTFCRTLLLLSKYLGLAPFSLAGNVGSHCLWKSAFGILYSITFPVVLSVSALCWSEIWHIKLTICDVSAGALYFIINFHFTISYTLLSVKMTTNSRYCRTVRCQHFSEMHLYTCLEKTVFCVKFTNMYNAGNLLCVFYI